MESTINRTWIFRTILCFLAVAFSLALIVGCSKNPITSTTTDDNQTKLDWLNQNMNVPEGANLAASINLNACQILYDTTIVQTVNQWGYQMNVIHGPEVVGFSLPYMAVPGPVTLTIHVTEWRAPNIGKFWVLDCGPNGQQFKYPLYVQPNAAARNGAVVVLFFWDPIKKLWVVQAVDAVPVNNPVQLPIYHFSKYAIS